MPPLDPSADAARLVRTLHGALLTGQIIVGGVFALVVYVRGPFNVSPLVGMALAAAAAVELGVALGLVRPRVPHRRADQEPNGYWATDEIRNRAQTVWFLTAGASVLALFGYLMTGTASAAAAALLAFAGLYWVRPAHFES